MSDTDELGVYTERAYLVALLAAMYPSYWDYSDKDAPDWPVVYVELPTGQASWHVAVEDFWLFEGVPKVEGYLWDGHDTAEKYGRVRELIKETLEGPEWCQEPAV